MNIQHKLVTFIVTLRQGQEGVIVQGLLPEILIQHKLFKKEMDSVLINLTNFMGDEEKSKLDAISQLLKRGIWLNKWFWFIAMVIGLGLTSIGILANSLFDFYVTSKSGLPSSKSATSICKKLKNYVPIAEILELKDYSPNFDGGKLTVKITTNATSHDCLTILDQKQSLGNLSINGQNITYKGNIIGNMKSVTQRNDLIVYLNEKATQEIVQDLARRVAYSLDISKNPSYSDRKIEFQVTDGDGGNSLKKGRLIQTIRIIDKNNPIVLNMPNSRTVKENTDFSISDINIKAFESQKIIVVLQVNEGKLLVKENVENGINKNEIVNNQTSKVTISGTVAEVNTTLADTNAIIYQGNKNFSNTDSLRVTISENRSEEKNTVTWPPEAQKSQIVSKTMDIKFESANPAPVIKVPSVQFINENEKLAISGISISDLNNQNITLTLEVKKGVLTLNTSVTKGLTSNNIKDNQTNKITINSSIEAINNTLAGTNNLIYQSQYNYRGEDNLIVTANDGEKATTKRVPIAVNDHPTLSIPEFVTTSSGVKITKPEAINIIDSWLKAKQKVFAYPFNSKILEQYTTGKYLSERIGTIQWLREKNAKYIYNLIQRELQGQFFIKDDQVNIDIKVREDITLFVQGKIERSGTDDNTTIYRWTLQLEDNLWKITDSKKIN